MLQIIIINHQFAGGTPIAGNTEVNLRPPFREKRRYRSTAKGKSPSKGDALSISIAYKPIIAASSRHSGREGKPVEHTG